MLPLARACGARHPALIDPGRIELINAGFRSLPLRDAVAYQHDWPLISEPRRTQIDDLIGPPAPRPRPGPQAGEDTHPRSGDPDAKHQDLRSPTETATEAG